MSDGDGRDSLKFLSERENQQSRRKKKKSGADEFAEAMARIAVAQVCESLGFQSFNQSALDSLADVGVRYIREIGKTASTYARLANRTQCNVFDVIQGLEDLGSVQGFLGASDVSHSLSGSGVVKDIIRYVGRSDEIPFAYLTHVFPVVKERALDPSFARAGENPPDEHIPNWLPKFPNPETYASLSSGNEKHSEIDAVNKIQPVDEHERKHTEKPLLNFHQKLIRIGFEPGVVEQGDDASKVQRAAENNPFLAPPLQYGEKELSLPVVPDKLLDGVADYHKGSDEALQNNLLTLGPSSRPHETVKSGSFEPEERNKILLNGRPSVQFKLRNGKKLLRTATSPRNESIVWFGDDHDGNEITANGADKILWEDAEYPPEVSHL